MYRFKNGNAFYLMLYGVLLPRIRGAIAFLDGILLDDEGIYIKNSFVHY